MKIGSVRLNGNLILAPMAGVTDRPFRILCRRYGASLAVSEMISSNPELQNTRKSLLRCDLAGEPEPRTIQILGACPTRMGEAAKLNVGRGAQVIDINMGCPAKKVCNVAAGSALLKDEILVARILESVVQAVDVPVTLKIRTGWDQGSRNAVNIAKIAESCGIKAIAIHGRTRACGFFGNAEYNTIAEAKSSVMIPVIANGDIDSPEKARFVLEQTGVDALMIGRAALGRPWLFTEIKKSLELGIGNYKMEAKQLQDVIIEHLSGLYSFYGEYAGVRIARKHIGWYLKKIGNFRTKSLNSILSAETADRQTTLIHDFFEFYH